MVGCDGNTLELRMCRMLNEVSELVAGCGLLRGRGWLGVLRF
jgi:hypothetical protein